MKRYRVIGMDFDTRANVLKLKIEDHWTPEIKASWQSTKDKIKEGLIIEFGTANDDTKYQNFIDIGSPPVSFLAFHNKFLKQIRHAYVIGSYYPSLVATCSLGERILNHLIIQLREYFKHTPEYKRVYKKDSFDNWDTAITTLLTWDIILPSVGKNFHKLKKLRNNALHFNPETDEFDQQDSLKAIKILQDIIKEQFGIMTTAPWYIEGINGASYIKKSFENAPFVKRVILPNCKLVGYKHKLELKDNGWKVVDNHYYGKKSLTDLEFKDLINSTYGS